jgi:hypothetical protein
LVEHGDSHERYGEAAVAVEIPVDDRGLRVSRSGLPQVAYTVPGAAGPPVGKPLGLVEVHDHSRMTSKACARYCCLDAFRVVGKGFHCFVAHSGACAFLDMLGTTYRQHTSPWLVWQAV